MIARYQFCVIWRHKANNHKRQRYTIPSQRGDKSAAFQVVDWEASVYLRGKFIGQNRGGYSPSSFDITPHLKKGDDTLVVGDWDGVGQHPQAIGKQMTPERSKGFRYRPTGTSYSPVC